VKSRPLSEIANLACAIGCGGVVQLSAPSWAIEFTRT
jgi:hypothetical protein